LHTKHVDLICATGGLASAQAAALAAQGQIPVLIIVGKMPTVTGNQYNDLTGNNVAGINLGTSGNIFDCASVLAGKLGLSSTTNILLLVNTKSQVGQDEQGYWQNAGRQCLVYAPGNDNNANEIDTVIAPMLAAAKKKGASGIVVNADPFFNLNRKKITAAVNNAGLQGCYPFLENVNDADGTYYYGPRLYNQYKSLGTMARQVLAMSQAQRLQIRQSIGISTAQPSSSTTVSLRRLWARLTGRQ
jgi:hypothetical protein